MANDKSFQQYLGVPNYNPSPTVSKLGGSGSTMSALSNIGSTLVEANAEYDKSSKLALLDEAYTKLNEGYFTQKEAYDEANANLQNTQIEAETVNDMLQYHTQNPTFQTGEEVDASYTRLTGIQKDLNDKLLKYKQAQEQGVMSSREYETRALDLTRELVAKNPHLSRELLGQLSLNMNLTGMQQRVRWDEEARKASREAYTKEKDRLEALGISKGINVFDKKYTNRVTNELNFELLKHDIGINIEDDAIADAFEQEAKTTKFRNQKEIDDFIDSGMHIKVGTSKLREFSIGLAKTLGQETDPVKQQTLITNYVANFKVATLGNFTTKAEADPRLKEYAATVTKSIDDIATNASNLSSGKSRSEYLANIASSLNSQNSLEYSKVYGNPLVNDVLIRLAPSMTQALLQVPGVKERFQDLLTTSATYKSGSGLGPNNNRPLTNTGDTLVDGVIAYSNNKATTSNGDVKEVTEFNNIIGNAYDTILNEPDLTLKYQATKKAIANIYHPSNAKSLEHLSPENKDKIRTLIAEQSTALFSSIVKAKEGKIQFKFNESDGTITTEDPNPDKGIVAPSAEFRSNVLAGINENLKAYAAINGVSTKAAAQEFYAKNFRELFDKDSIPKEDYSGKAKEVVSKIFTKEVTDANRPEGTFGRYNISLQSMLNPGPGLKPLDTSLTGAEYEKAQKEHATQMLTRLSAYYKGDMSKTEAAYIMGYGKVDALVQKYGNDWFAKGAEAKEIPPKTVAYLKESVPESFLNETTLKKDAIAFNTTLQALEKNHPAEYKAQFGDNDKKLEWIAEQVRSKYNLPASAFTWEKVGNMLNTMEQVDQKRNPTSTMSQRNNPFRGGTLASIFGSNVDPILAIQQDYADAFTRSKDKFTKGLITKEQYGDEASNLNAGLKRDIAIAKNKFPMLEAMSSAQKIEVGNAVKQAWDVKNNPEKFKQLSKQEQEELNLFLDQPLEKVHPEELLFGATALTRMLGVKFGTKAAGKAAEKTVNKVFLEDRAIKAKPLSKSKIEELNKTDAQRRKILEEESKPVRNTKGNQTSVLEKGK